MPGEPCREQLREHRAMNLRIVAVQDRAEPISVSILTLSTCSAAIKQFPLIEARTGTDVARSAACGDRAVMANTVVPKRKPPAKSRCYSRPHLRTGKISSALAVKIYHAARALQSLCRRVSAVPLDRPSNSAQQGR